MRVADFAADWPYSHPRPTPETNRHYRQMVRRFVDRFGSRLLTDVTVAEVQVWAMENLSAVRYVRAMYADAVADGHVAVNPVARVKVPRPPRRRRDEAVPTLEEVEILLGDDDRQIAACVALGAFAGLRAGEILGLQFGDIAPNLDRAYVHQQRGRGGALKPIKGKVKAREVDVFARGRTTVLEWGNTSDDEVYVVGPLLYDEMAVRWRAVRKRCGLTCEFHQLRAFCATWLLEMGASPIDVAVQLHGHTDPTVVLSYYSMIDKGKALERLRRVVDGGQ